MKVCLLNDAFPPVIDGVVNVLLNYAKYLTSDCSTGVMVGTPKYPDADYSVYPYPVVPYRSLGTEELASGYRTGIPFSDKAIAKMTDFAPDIIHTHCPASATVMARLLREETGAPVILTYHTKYDIDIERVVKSKTLAKETVRAMVGNIEACDEIWAVSRGAGESLKSLGFKGDYRVMNNGVDFAKGRVSREAVAAATDGYDLPDGVPVFLFVGRMMTYKGLPIILDALKLLSDDGVDFRMVFVGKGPDQELLEKTAESYGLMGGGGNPAKVIFTGPVYDRDILRAWNTRADLFLFPSTFDTNGLVVREAAACGLASVLIKGSCAAEGITDGRNGFTIEQTPEAMYSLLKKLYSDLDYVHTVGQNAMDEIYLSWQSCVTEAYDRYREVLELKQKGLLPVREKLPTDYLVKLTAKSMEGQEKQRRMIRGIFSDFKEATTGMMGNFRDMREEVRDGFHEMKEGVRDGLHDVKEMTAMAATEVRENAAKDREEFQEAVFSAMEELQKR